MSFGKKREKRAEVYYVQLKRMERCYLDSYAVGK